MSVRGRNDVISRPIVGASQMTATRPIAMWIGVLLRPRRMRALIVFSLARGTAWVAIASVLISDHRRASEPTNVEDHHRDQDQEHDDRDGGRPPELPRLEALDVQLEPDHPRRG